VQLSGARCQAYRKPALSPLGERVARSGALTSRGATGEGVGGVGLRKGRIHADEKRRHVCATRPPEGREWKSGRAGVRCQVLGVRLIGNQPSPPLGERVARSGASTSRGATGEGVGGVGLRKGRIHADEKRRHVCATRVVKDSSSFRIFFLPRPQGAELTLIDGSGNASQRNGLLGYEPLDNIQLRRSPPREQLH
jgi:hypothetical protein